MAVERGDLDVAVAEQQVQPMLARMRSPGRRQDTSWYGDSQAPKRPLGPAVGESAEVGVRRLTVKAGEPPPGEVVPLGLRGSGSRLNVRALRLLPARDAAGPMGAALRPEASEVRAGLDGDGRPNASTP